MGFLLDCCTLWLNYVVGKTLWTEETLSPLLSLYALYPSVDVIGNGTRLSPLLCCERDASVM